MDQVIRAITEKYLKMLDSNREYHTPELLLDAGLPEYLVKRIRLELIRNLQDSVRPPESDWANMNAVSVTQALEQFLQAIREEVRLPSSYAKTVIESALSDILELLVTPRAFLPDYLFGSEQSLDVDSVRERCEWIVVYRYFSDAIPRFMEKKERDFLTREQADRIIERLDERVTSPYTSLNWGQLFEPWFTLMGETVDPTLFASFFRDKGKPGVARLFDSEEEPIHRTRLIEILSRPQLDEHDDDLSDLTNYNLRENSAITKEKPQSIDQEPFKPIVASGIESPGPTTVKDRPGFVKSEKKIPRSSIDNSPFSSVKAFESESTDSEMMIDKPLSDNRPVRNPEEIDINKKSGIRKDTKEAEDNLLGRFRATKSDIKDELPLHSRLKTEIGEEEENWPFHSSIKGDAGSETSTEIPIWQRFTEVRPDMSDEEKAETIKDRIAASLRTSEDKSDPAFDSDHDLDDPVTSLKSKPATGSRVETNFKFAAGSGQDTEPEPHEIRVHVKDLERQFVDELFGGDENAYLEALIEIEHLKDWKQAGKYISNEIFNRNLIDIYSDTAIDFTDRMQTYFLERSM